MRPHALAALLAVSLATAAPHASHPPAQPSWRRLSDALIESIWPPPQPRLPPSHPHHLPTPYVARYGDDVVLRFTIHTPAEARALAAASDVLFLDVWEFNDDWADIRVAKHVVPSLLGLLPSSLHHAHQPLMQDLDLAHAVFDSYPAPTESELFVPHTSTHIDTDIDTDTNTHTTHTTSSHPFLQDYQPLSVIDPWMRLMASMFPTHVRRISLGTTHEGRDMPALRIGVQPAAARDPRPPRKTILITAGSHAREWISTSTVTYLAWHLINAYGKDRDTTRLLETFDFVLVPTLNPDGYAYTWESDRLWRKNRQPTPLRFCTGLDLDRTYPFQWDQNNARTNPCSESYAGAAPLDAVEPRQFTAWAQNETANNNVQFVAFLDLHSYSQQILYPYAYSCADSPPALEDLEELALGLAKAMRVSHKGRAYKVASACEGNVAMNKDKKEREVLPRIESAGGSALDFFHHEMHVKYAFQIKLRDTGSYGFLLPKEHIAPTGEEVLGAVLYLGRFMSGQVGVLDESKSDSAGEGVRNTTADASEEVMEL